MRANDGKAEWEHSTVGFLIKILARSPGAVLTWPWLKTRLHFTSCLSLRNRLNIGNVSFLKQEKQSKLDWGHDKKGVKFSCCAVSHQSPSSEVNVFSQ